MSGSIRVFDKYDVVRRLGSGGMGDIFLARQQAVAGFDRLVVLKSLRPDIAGDETFLAQFLNEARVAATINHPNVVVVYEVGEYRGVYFIAMEFIDGVDLSAVLRASASAQQRIPFRYSMGVIHDAALGLDHAHNAGSESGRPLGIVHRDVSPHNLMVRLDGVVKVVDFGIAAVSTSVQPKNRLQGKLRYMSPEQVRTEILDGRSDQFALGIVLWELCTQRRLFNGDTPRRILDMVLRAEVPRPSEFVPDIPPALEEVVLRMLARDRSDRFASCREVAFALRQIMQQTGGATDQLVSRYTSLLLGAQVRDRLKNLTPEPVTISGLLDQTDRHCLSCGHKNSIRDRFCAACGSSLYRTGGSDTETSDSGSGSEYLADLDLDGGGGGIKVSDLLGHAQELSALLSGERRRVVCLAARVHGASELAKRAGARLSGLEAAFRQAIAAIGSGRSVDVLEISATSFSLVLGSRASSPVDLENGLRIARTVADSISAAASALGLPIELTIAVDEGESDVRLTPGVEPELGGPLLPGTQALAALGAELGLRGIIVPEALGDRLSSELGLSPVVLREASEQTALVRAFLLSGPLELGDPRRPGFIGRSVEQVRAGEIMSAAVQGQPGALVFTAEPGLGRTRLLEELRLRAVAKGMAPVLLSASHVGDRLAFMRLLVGRVLGAMVIRPAEGPEATVSEGLEWVAKIKGLAPHLLARLRIELDDKRSLAGASHEEAQQIEATLIRVVRALCAVRPLCLFVDDLHLLDSDKLSLLANLVVRGSSSRIALFAAADVAEIARVGEHFTTTELSPLTDAMLLGIAKTVTQGRAIPKEAQQRVLECAGGSPGFAMLLVQLMVDRGALEEVDGHWQVTERFLNLELPRRLESLVAARLDRLSREGQDFLRVCAVQGVHFSPGLSARALGLDKETGRRVALECLRSRLVEPARGKQILVFAQASVRKVLLSRFLDSDLRNTHLRLATVLIEVTRPEDVEAMISISQHLLEAKAGATAAAYAGHTAQLLPSGEKATELYRAAIDYLSEHPPGPATPMEEAVQHHRLLARAIPCLASKDLSRAERVLERALGRMPAELDPVGRAECHRQRALVRLELGRLADAAADLDVAEALLPPGTSARIRAMIWSDQALLLEKSGKLPAAAAKLVTVLGVIGEDASQSEAAAWVQSNALGRVYFRMGEAVRAGALFESAFDQARRAQSLEGQTKALTNLATVKATSGDGQGALALLARASALAERHADPIAQSRIAHNRGLVLLELKDPIAAREAILEASAIARDVGWAEGIAAAAQTLQAHALPPRS